MEKRILITGVNGFLGSRLFEYFKEQEGYDVLGVTHRELEVSDSLAVTAFINAIRPDYVLHCAGVSDTGICEAEPELSEQINVRGNRQHGQGLQAVQYKDDIYEFGPDL